MYAKKDPILLKMDKNNTLNTYRKVWRMYAQVLTMVLSR